MIPTIKKILYVSDIQDGSRPAFRMAMSLAKQYRAEILFLHVLVPIPESVKISIQSSLSAEEYNKVKNQGMLGVKKDINQRISDFCQSETEDSDWQPKIKPVVLEGGINTKILEASDLYEADMVVMGTRTHSATKEFLMGSTAHKITRYSKIPVLVVPLS